MVGARGFEPPTPWSQTRCATRLRYAPTRPDYKEARRKCKGFRTVMAYSAGRRIIPSRPRYCFRKCRYFHDGSLKLAQGGLFIGGRERRNHLYTQANRADALKPQRIGGSLHLMRGIAPGGICCIGNIAHRAHAPRDRVEKKPQKLALQGNIAVRDLLKARGVDHGIVILSEAKDPLRREILRPRLRMTGNLIKIFYRLRYEFRNDFLGGLFARDDADALPRHHRSVLHVALDDRAAQCSCPEMLDFKLRFFL